jgi:6-phosphogluconate dehydrogenase
VIILVKAGAPVDQTIEGLLAAGMEAGDIVVDGGNEWCAAVLIRCCGGAPEIGAPESRRSL